MRTAVTESGTKPFSGTYACSGARWARTSHGNPATPHSAVIMTALLIAISFGLSNAAAHLQARQKKRAKRAILSSLTRYTVRGDAGARHAAGEAAANTISPTVWDANPISLSAVCRIFVSGAP